MLLATPRSIEPGVGSRFRRCADNARAQSRLTPPPPRASCNQLRTFTSPDNYSSKRQMPSVNCSSNYSATLGDLLLWKDFRIDHKNYLDDALQRWSQLLKDALVIADSYSAHDKYLHTCACWSTTVFGPRLLFVSSRYILTFFGMSSDSL